MNNLCLMPLLTPLYLNVSKISKKNKYYIILRSSKCEHPNYEFCIIEIIEGLNSKLFAWIFGLTMLWCMPSTKGVA